MFRSAILGLAAWAALAPRSPAQELGESGFVDSGGVKIHYQALGEESGPLVVMIHGFPDYWYTWREQMPEIAKKGHRVVAIDQRGYNLSDKPVGVENYAIEKLVADVDAVRQHFRSNWVTLVGHDWGGFVAWSYAMAHPEHTSRLVILNLPHPKGLLRELANNPDQRKNSQYARNFQQLGAAKLLTTGALTAWVKDPEARQLYDQAMQRSDKEAMLNYYKANYPREPYKDDREFPRVKCPVLMIHGLKDEALLPGALNDTWKWIDGELTLVTVPGAGHFVQQDASRLVTQRIVGWLEDTVQP